MLFIVNVYFSTCEFKKNVDAVLVNIYNLTET